MANEDNKPKTDADEISDESLDQVTGGITAVKPVISLVNQTDSSTPSGWDLKANKSA